MYQARCGLQQLRFSSRHSQIDGIIQLYYTPSTERQKVQWSDEAPVSSAEAPGHGARLLT